MNPEFDWDWFESCLKSKAWEDLSPEEQQNLTPWFTEDAYNAERQICLNAWHLLQQDTGTQLLPPLSKKKAFFWRPMALAAGVFLTIGLAWVFWPSQNQNKVLSFSKDSTLLEQISPKRTAQDSMAWTSKTQNPTFSQETNNLLDQKQKETNQTIPAPQTEKGEDPSSRTPALAFKSDVLSLNNSEAVESDAFMEREETNSAPQGNAYSHAGAPAAEEVVVLPSPLVSSDRNKNKNALLKQVAAPRDTFWRNDSLLVRWGSPKKPDSIRQVMPIPVHWRKIK